MDIGFTISTQQADNQILVNDGETAAIGGLTVTNVTVTKSASLPCGPAHFGQAVRVHELSEERRDLLILITPHIIDDLASTSAGNPRGFVCWQDGTRLYAAVAFGALVLGGL